MELMVYGGTQMSKPGKGLEMVPVVLEKTSSMVGLRISRRWAYVDGQGRLLKRLMPLILRKNPLGKDQTVFRFCSENEGH